MLITDSITLSTDKFNAEGDVLFFPGNTIICHLDRQSSLFNKLVKFYDVLESFNNHNQIIAQLPVDSYHMTIFDSTSKIEGKFNFPKGKGIESLDDSNTFIINALKESKLTTAPKEMYVESIKFASGTIGLGLVEKDLVKKPLRHLRDKLSQLTNIKHPGHDEYKFHITLAYFCKIPNEKQNDELTMMLSGFYDELTQEDKSVTLGKAEFCTFENMYKFNPIYMF
ncbi:DUF1868 domain-containing protein [Thorsellia kenyensis]|uniref:DUF1868 domain-containing protein n=1 Tax=Thorsellia kenyensis TaxID=1549888 RepID=A0ABV6CD30_9GAMM